jgi:hypothetical protein
MEKYNKEKLIKVKTFDFEKDIWIKYKEEKRILGFLWTKKGFYIELFHETYIGLEIPINHTLIDGIVYLNPRTVLYYENDFIKTYYFKTLKEAINFAESIANDNYWIS